ncbi:MAG TPA: penicillin acylase family protein [Longimicrobiales bacterium]|nr:penicillin acylase family protein [Longimicrobiales bacterium]
MSQLTMRRALATGAAALGLAAGLAARAHQENFESLARASLSQLDGEIPLPGLRAPVTVLRDSMGVPHIYASNVDDLFLAQGFVQAQDRLWQMDMYHRTFSGRLSEIFGASYNEHDAKMRLLQYRGPWDDSEFTSYHPDGRRIFESFARGVNAYIDHAGDRLPVEYRLTGLRPLRWTPQASLLRTQTAMPLGDARAELSLARQVVEFGAAEANRRARPSPYRDLVVPADVDLTAIDDSVVAGLAGMRTGIVRPPLLPQYQRWLDALPRENNGAQENSPGSNNWAVSGRLTATGKPFVANDPHRNVANPSIRYIVHLNAPGWDMIGATEAPLPGVAIGHNGRFGWGLTIVGTDQSDVYVERLNPSNRDQVMFRGQWENIRTEYDTIRGPDSRVMRVVAHRFSRHGPIFHIDSTRNLAYAMKSTMHLPGSAGYVSTLRYNSLANCREFLDAQVYYFAPTENMVCGDADGNIAWQASAAAPKRPNWHGRLPVPGTGAYEWDGLRDDLPREFNPERGWIATANHDIHPPGYDPPLFFKQGSATARYDRLASILSSGTRFTLEDMRRLQLDSYLLNGARDIALFNGWTASTPELERLRAMIASWDGMRRRESAAAALHNFVASRITAAARAEDSPPAQRRQLLETALQQGRDELVSRQGADPAQWRWGLIQRSELPHPLVRAYDIPAVERSGGANTVAATGATYRQIIDTADFDRSIVTNAPGQSAQPFSPFYANLVASYGRGDYYTLPYSRPAVERAARHRLTLTPRN